MMLARFAAGRRVRHTAAPLALSPSACSEDIMSDCTRGGWERGKRAVSARTSHEEQVGNEEQACR